MRPRDNPFRAECIESLSYRAPGFAWELIEGLLGENRGRGAIVGPEGRGKTTLLLEWRDRLERRGVETTMVRLVERQRRLTKDQIHAVAGADAVIVDSAEQLGWLGWRECRRAAEGAGMLVIASHVEGRLPTVWRALSDFTLLSELVNELDAGIADVEPLWRRHDGNVRNCLRELYDRRADARQPHGRELHCEGQGR